MCVVMEPTIKEGLPRQSLAPDDSFLRSFFYLQESTFEAGGRGWWWCVCVCVCVCVYRGIRLHDIISYTVTKFH